MMKKEDNVMLMPKITDVNVILDKASSWGLTKVVVIGWDENQEFRIGGNDTSLQEISWLLVNAQDWLRDAM